MTVRRGHCEYEYGRILHQPYESKLLMAITADIICIHRHLCADYRVGEPAVAAPGGIDTNLRTTECTVALAMARFLRPFVLCSPSNTWPHRRVCRRGIWCMGVYTSLAEHSGMVAAGMGDFGTLPEKNRGSSYGGTRRLQRITTRQAV